MHEILENGAFSIRRTESNYNRTAVDLSLEQSLNRDASSEMRGIVHFRNSENTMRRWALNMVQRAMAITELRTLVGLEKHENVLNECRPYQIEKDNIQMTKLEETIEEFCNPFKQDSPSFLVNISTGQSASHVTEQYLCNTLIRGQKERDNFQKEWASDSSRFLERVKCTSVDNFASQNVKKKKTPAYMNAKSNAESLRDVFVRMVIAIAEKNII